MLWSMIPPKVHPPKQVDKVLLYFWYFTTLGSTFLWAALLVNLWL